MRQLSQKSNGKSQKLLDPLCPQSEGTSIERKQDQTTAHGTTKE